MRPLQPHALHIAARAAVPLALATLAAAQPIGFPSRMDMLTEMSVAATNHPAICEFVDLTARYGTPTTVGGLSHFAVKISDNVANDEDEPAFLMVSAHHGNEYGTPIVALDTIARLTSGYGSDPQITALVNGNEIWIAPLWNQDGYSNQRTNGNGVDLNRNYPFLWDTACNSGVRGPSPGSEPETQTMIAFSEDRRFTKVIDFHSSGRETLWGYRPACGQNVLGAFLEAEAIAISQASGYGGLVRAPSSNGEHYQWQLGNYANYAFLTEISNTQSPSRMSADAEAAQVWPGTQLILERPIPVRGHVTDGLNGLPLEADITYVENPFTLGERNRSAPRFGRYHAFLPNGAHTLRFDAPGYTAQEIPVVVTASGVDLDVALMPDSVRFAFPNGIPIALEPGGGTTIRVVLSSPNGSLVPGSGTVSIISTNETRRDVPMTQRGPGVYDAVFPPFACGDSVRFSFAARDTAGTVWTSPGDGSDYAASTAVLRNIIVANDFESPAGWTGGQPGDTAIRGIWGRADPQPTSAQPGDDHTPGAGTQCWVTDGRAGASVGSFDVDQGFTTLLSPAFDLTLTPDARISYWRWFVNNGNNAVDDVFRVDISDDDGQSWTNVETLGPTGPETGGGWFQNSVRVADLVTPSANVRLRFIAEDIGSGSIVEAAIDDVSIAVETCNGEVVRSGNGCADGSGTTLRMTHDGQSRIDETLQLGVETGSNVPFVLFIGLPLNPALPIPGTAGCALGLSVSATLGPWPAGQALSIQVPSDPTLAGIHISWQAAIADASLTQPIPVATSDMLTTVIGT